MMLSHARYLPEVISNEHNLCCTEKGLFKVDVGEWKKFCAICYNLENFYSSFPVYFHFEILMFGKLLPSYIDYKISCPVISNVAILNFKKERLQPKTKVLSSLYRRRTNHICEPIRKRHDDSQYESKTFGSRTRIFPNLDFCPRGIT